MESADQWPGGLIGQMNPFGQQFDTGNQNEDWEDWLRWDPAAEPTSPEEGTMNSGSSKTTSPIQDPVFPVDTNSFGKGAADDTLAPPLIVGEDMLDFNNTGNPHESDPFMFGAPNDASTFDFNSTNTFQPIAPNMHKINTNTAAWPLVSNDPQTNISLSALSNEHSQYPASTASATTPSLHHSPESSQKRSSLSSNQGSPDPAPKKRGGRKRKAEAVAQEPSPEQKEESAGDSQDGDEPPIKKTSHNVIEKRYRNNLNDKIVELRNSVPSLRAMGRANNKEKTEDLGGLTPAHKLNKATVMGKATEYIKFLEKKNKSMSNEMDALKARLAAVESAIGVQPADRQMSMSNSPPGDAMRSRQPSSSSQTGMPNFLNVPGFGQPGVQQQYMQPQQPHPQYARAPNPPVEAQNQPQYANGRGGGVMNKVMMGAMAGVMMMEGFSEHQSDDTRQMFAFPVLSRRGLFSSPSSVADFSKQATVPLLKIAVVFGVLVYLLAPLLTFTTRKKQPARTAVRLPHAPSLASPVEVRRKAWLTALQTVYVPKHFLLEVVAVAAKMSMLSIRRLIGSDAYNSLTGTNKEDEIARIKAWDIAIDAQLAGGDAEVSYYRLLLTLMTSGTLPDSPARLMQKAVHFRVFFWDVANAGYGNILGFKSFTEKVGKIYWDSARKMQKELVHARSQGRPTEHDDIELLPEHLANLLDLDCDEVLGDEMIQRAWNLAWNKPSAHGTTANALRDIVVEDHAIRSPLDAVAAWYANMMIDDTLVDTLGQHASNWDAEYYSGLAVSIAPPASGTQIRALAAKAVLSNMNRERNILAALEALPASSPASESMNIVNHAPASPDICVALTLTKLLSLVGPSAPEAARKRAQDMMANMNLDPSGFSLLSAVAAYRLLRTLTSDRNSKSISVNHGLENTAASLRVWTGTSAGRTAGLDGESCGKVVDLCLSVARKIGGWEEADSGYGSREGSPVRQKAELSAL